MNREEKSFLLAQLHNYIVFSNLWMFLSFKFSWDVAIFISPVGRFFFSGNLRNKIKGKSDWLLSQWQTIFPIQTAYWWRGSESILQRLVSSKPVVPGHCISPLLAAEPFDTSQFQSHLMRGCWRQPHDTGRARFETFIVHPSQSLCPVLLTTFFLVGEPPH